MPSLQVIETVSGLRDAVAQWRRAGDTVALVPTMGALHRGHIALVEQARKQARRVIVSIFVNPLQFAAHEDLAHYPRQLAQDQALLVEAGCDALYAPTVAEMYGEGQVTRVDPGPLGTVWEGAARPGHFTGVATVVAKLLLQALPDIALFGEKDYQQLLVIRRIVADLNIPVEIIGVPTVRDADGFALSSRNAYLSAEERQQALALPQTLQNVATAIKAGQDSSAALQTGLAALAQAGFVTDYLALVDAVDLTAVQDLSRSARLIAAARIGATRLIDNIAV